MKYGMIPFGLHDLSLNLDDRALYASPMCSQCGAPRSSIRCAYCGTYARVRFDADDPCPRCGAQLDRTFLAGDNVTIATFVQCHRCGFSR